MNNLIDSSDNDIIDFIIDFLNNDDKYVIFLDELKNYKKYAGYSDEIDRKILLLLETIERYSYDVNSIDSHMIISMFKWVLSSLNNMKETSTIRRNLIDDFKKK
jgi:hypothetical protein